MPLGRIEDVRLGRRKFVWLMNLLYTIDPQGLCFESEAVRRLMQQESERHGHANMPQAWQAIVVNPPTLMQRIFGIR